MADRYIIVHRSYDPVVTDMVGDVLRSNNIAARVMGTRSGAAIGAGQNIMELYIEVPEPQAGQATDFLEDFFRDNGAELLRQAGVVDEDWGPDDEATEIDHISGRPESRRRPLLAAAFGAFGFGLSHFYSRHSITGLAILVGYAVAFVLALNITWHTGTVAVGVVILLVAYDIVAGQLAVRAYLRGDRASSAQQSLRGCAAVVAIVFIAWWAAPAIVGPEPGSLWGSPGIEG